MPTACAAAPRRVRSSVASATLKPPILPITFSAGRGRRRRSAAPVGEPRIPSLCSSLPTLKPGRSASTTKAVIPRVPGLAVGDGEDDVEVGDPRALVIQVFGAVDHPLVAVLDRGGAHRRRDPSPPRARTVRRPATTRRSRISAGSAASARRSRTAGSAACRAPGSSGSAPWTRTPWRSPRPPICSISVPVPVPPYSLVEGQPEDVLLGEQLADVVRVLGVAVDVGGPRRDLLGARSGGSFRGSRPSPAGSCRARRAQTYVDATGRTERSALRPGWSAPGRSEGTAERVAQSPVG